MSLSLVKRCQICCNVIDDEEDFVRGDDPDLCELCNDVAAPKNQKKES